VGRDSLVGAFSKDGWSTVHTYLIELALILQLYPAEYHAPGARKGPFAGPELAERASPTCG
jgi:hypothetical protein